MPSIQVDDYSVRLTTGVKEKGESVEAKIRVDAASLRFLLTFVPKATAELPPNYEEVANQRTGMPDGSIRNIEVRWQHIFLPSQHYSWYLDLLRNEGPHNIVYDPAKPQTFYLRTGDESPGEGED